MSRKRTAFASPEYLAIAVSFAAFAVSLYQPLSDHFARPRLEIVLPSYMTVTSNLGIPQFSPMVVVVNNGSVAGSFAEMRCMLVGTDTTIDMRATSITVPIPGGLPTTMPIAANSLDVSEEFLNFINCMPESRLIESIDSYGDLTFQGHAEARIHGGINCNTQWQDRAFRYSNKLSSDILEFHDRNFVMKPGRYIFEVFIADRDGKVISSDSGTIDVTQQTIKRLDAVRDLLPYGFGIICPMPGTATVELNIRRAAI